MGGLGAVLSITPPQLGSSGISALAGASADTSVPANNSNLSSNGGTDALATPNPQATKSAAVATPKPATKKSATNTKTSNSYLSRMERKMASQSEGFSGRV